MSDNSAAASLDNAFYQAVFEGGTQALGDIILKALNKAGIKANETYMHDIYILLGDPALRIKGTAKVVGIQTLKGE